MSIYDFSYKSIAGNPVSMTEYAGKVLLIVNTASKCGFTYQYEGLEKLYETYKDRGLVVIGFPCNQFMGQEPGDEKKISSFCSIRYGVTFPLSAKVEVLGENAVPLYKYLTAESNFEGFGKGFKAKMMAFMSRKRAKEDKNGIKWNFTKFLIDRNGNIVKRFEPTVKPEEIAADIEKVLKGVVYE